MKSRKSYIGDSVYVDVNQFSQIVLTTENGEGPSNEIFLEYEVYEALVEYINDFKLRAGDRLSDRKDADGDETEF